MLRVLLSVLTFCAFAWTAGLVVFIDSIPNRADDPLAITDAIVVLTGGEGRVEHGFTLMEQGLAKSLFISGVGKGVTKDALLQKYASAKARKQLDAQLELDYAADSTRNNAMQTARFIREREYHSLRLVTAGYHMRRSLAECRLLMPEVRIIADPVSPKAFRRDQWWRDATTRKLVLSEYHKYGLVRLRGFIGEAV